MQTFFSFKLVLIKSEHRRAEKEQKKNDWNVTNVSGAPHKFTILKNKTLIFSPKFIVLGSSSTA